MDTNHGRFADTAGWCGARHPVSRSAKHNGTRRNSGTEEMAFGYAMGTEPTPMAALNSTPGAGNEDLFYVYLPLVICLPALFLRREST